MWSVLASLAELPSLSRTFAGCRIGRQIFVAKGMTCSRSKDVGPGLFDLGFDKNEEQPQPKFPRCHAERRPRRSDAKSVPPSVLRNLLSASGHQLPEPLAPRLPRAPRAFNMQQETQDGVGATTAQGLLDRSGLVHITTKHCSSRLRCGCLSLLSPERLRLNPQKLFEQWIRKLNWSVSSCKSRSWAGCCLRAS